MPDSARRRRSAARQSRGASISCGLTAAVSSQPWSTHKGGNLVFGPDGYLFVGIGDGDEGNDPLHLAQNPLSLLGKMLRLDVSVDASHPTGYVVPGNNPFVGRGDVLPEIWAIGLRNPWRFSLTIPGVAEPAR